MSDFTTEVSLEKVADGDTVTISRVGSKNGLRHPYTVTGVISDLTRKPIGTFVLYQFILTEKDGTQTNMAGMSNWTVALHLPLWAYFNEQHGDSLCPWLAPDIQMYRVWSAIVEVHGLTKTDLVDKYVEALVGGTLPTLQSREAYYQEMYSYTTSA